jgi:hypothetical protein
LDSLVQAFFSLLQPLLLHAGSIFAMQLLFASWHARKQELPPCASNNGLADWSMRDAPTPSAANAVDTAKRIHNNAIPVCLMIYSLVSNLPANNFMPQ